MIMNCCQSTKFFLSIKISLKTACAIKYQGIHQSFIHQFLRKHQAVKFSTAENLHYMVMLLDSCC